MANNFKLVTKSGGTVTAKNDGAFFEAVIPDSILVGCGMSYSGSSLTIAAGTMCIKGRVFAGTAASSWSMPTSGEYAWLVAQISNDVLSFSTSATEPTLTQQDINIAGTTYQAIIAKVEISGGAIVGIEEQIPAYQTFGGVLYGTAETPASTNYADGTLYVQYSG